jgi:hypothetical protein
MHDLESNNTYKAYFYYVFGDDQTDVNNLWPPCSPSFWPPKLLKYNFMGQISP